MTTTLRSHRCKVDDENPEEQARLRAEWKRDTAGLSPEQIGEILDGAQIPVRYPSDFRTAREHWAMATGWKPAAAAAPSIYADEDDAKKLARQKRDAELAAWHQSPEGKAERKRIFAQVPRDPTPTQEEPPEPPSEDDQDAPPESVGA